MEHEQVIVRLPYVRGGSTRVGVIVRREGATYWVRWEDTGREDEQGLGEWDRLVVRDSLPYEAIVAPERLRESFAADPKALIRRLLHERAEPMTAVAVKKELMGCGLAGEDVDAAWPAASRAFVKDPDITVVGKATRRTYQWTQPAVEGAPDPPSLPPAESGTEPSVTVNHSVQVEASAAMQAPAFAVLLAGAADRLRDSASAKPEALGAAVAVVRRAVRSGTLESADAPALATLGALIMEREDNVETPELVAHELARLIACTPPEGLGALDPGVLVAIATRLPLKPDGGRAALQLSVARAWKERAVDAVWWRGVALDDLVACARGPLGSVTAAPEFASIIRLMVVKEASAVTSLRRLAWLLGLPREFAREIPPELMAAAIRRVAAEDGLVASWTEALSTDSRVDALTHDLGATRTEVQAAHEQMRVQQERIRELTEHCKQLEEVLRAEHREAADLRAAQDRQIKIDIVRALADLAAEVEELAADASGSQLLVERVRALAAAQSLVPVGSAGEELPFDPALHDPIVGSPAGNDRVIVIRPGYQWRPTDQVILLGKAVVSTI